MPRPSHAFIWRILTQERSAAEAFSPALRRAVGVVMIGAAMSFLDSTIVNIAIDTLTRSFHASLADAQWVITGYLLALAAVIPATGWAARRVGASRLYMATLALFTFGSVMCASSGNIDWLVASRVIQGVGGGATLPVGTIIWTDLAAKGQMARVMSLVGIPVVLAPMLGPTIGGFLIQSFSWRAIFWINIPFGVLALALAPRLLPRSSGQNVGPLDWIGFLLVSGGSVGLTYGLFAAGIQAALGVRAAAALAAGTALLAVFVMRATRIKRPLLNLRLYANRFFAAASITSVSLGAAMFGGMILMPLYLQIVRGEDVIQTGLLLIPSGLGALISNRLAATLTDQFGAGATSLVGGVIGAVSTVPFVFLGDSTSYWFLGLAMMVRGLGVGLSLMPTMTAAYRAVLPHQIADATPQLNVLQRLGGAVGTTVFTIILTHRLQQAGVSLHGRAVAFGTTFLWTLVATVVATAPALLLMRSERSRTAAAP